MNSTNKDQNNASINEPPVQKEISQKPLTQRTLASVAFDLAVLKKLLETNYAMEAKTLMRSYLASPEKKSDILFHAAELFLKHEISDMAEVTYKAILEHDKNNVPALGRLGDIMQKRGDYRSAINYFRQIIKHDPVPQDWVYIGLGNALECIGEIDEAVNFFNKSMKTGEFKPELLIRIENLINKQKLIKGGGLDAKDNIDRESNNPYIHRDIGYLEAEAEAASMRTEEGVNEILNSRIDDLSAIIAEFYDFFNNDFCQYHLGVPLHSDKIEHYYESYISSHGRFPRISVYFDPDYYLSEYPDVGNKQIDPLKHFIYRGVVELRNPHPLIDLRYISLKKHPKLKDLSGLINYILNNSSLSAYFDSSFYYAAYPDIENAKLLAFDHFIISGANEKRKPNNFFDYDLYQAHKPALTNAGGLDIIVDFARYGDKDKTTFSDKFDYEYYEKQVKNQFDENIPLFKHYMSYGMAEKIPPKEQVAFANINPYASADLYAVFQEHSNVHKSLIKHVQPKIFSIPEKDAIEIIHSLRFVKTANPDVSIVIPVYNAIKEVAECLLSINKYLKGSYEVLIADDKSTDNRVETAFKNHKYIRYLRNKENLGFLLNVNKAISMASGKYILLLNSDIQVLDNILETLRQALIHDKQVGIAAPKIIFPSGVLQEAGCSIYSNCTTEMLGIGKNAEDGLYNFKRYVDYISGACWFFEKQLFNTLGGFDKSFAPAYAEDLDFCAKLTQVGKKILYVPDSVIIHHLSVSSNLLGSSYKYYQSAVNKNKFNDKYQSFYKKHSKVKPIAFYLPQYHEIKQNSYWWGKNYTEWRATANAVPQFDGHYQPHIPSDLGFYNLTDEKTFELQANMAIRYGLYGFCFYYYNFGDFELMKEALQTFIKSKASINFCLCWANENWTKRWDGSEENVLLEQKGNDDNFFLKALKDMECFIIDSRYIRVDGSPLILIYRESLFDNISSKIKLWRDYWKQAHNENLYICSVDSMERSGGQGGDPCVRGFDAAVEFPVHGIQTRSVLNEEMENFKGTLMDYPDVVKEICFRPHPGYKRFPCCFPSWDNTPRRAQHAMVMRYAHPSAFQFFLEQKVKEAMVLSGDERMLFINAWNEWGEGAHLEPDMKFGHSWLATLENVLKEFS